MLKNHENFEDAFANTLDVYKTTNYPGNHKP